MGGNQDAETEDWHLLPTERSFPSNGTGSFQGSYVADILAAHPATARFLAGRLIAFFGASDPHGALQGRLAETFSAHAGSEVQMARVVEALLASPEFG